MRDGSEVDVEDGIDIVSYPIYVDYEADIDYWGQKLVIENCVKDHPILGKYFDMFEEMVEDESDRMIDD